MYITTQTLITAGAVLSALVAFVTLFWKLFSWISHQKEQDSKIESLEAENKKLREDLDKEKEDVRELISKESEAVRDMHNADNNGLQEEQTLIVYGLLACLKGLSEKGCNGPVSEAIGRIEKHLNMKAHGQQ